MLNRRFLRIKAMQSLYALDQWKHSDYQLALEKITGLFKSNSADDPPAENTPDQIRELFKKSVLAGELISDPSASAEVTEIAANSFQLYQQQVQKDFDQSYQAMINSADRVEDYFFSLIDLLLIWSDIARVESSKKSYSAKPIDQANRNFYDNHIVSVFRESDWLKDKKKTPVWTNGAGEAKRWYKDIVKKDETFLKYQRLAEPDFEDDKKIILYLIKKVIFRSEPIKAFMEETDINWEEDRDIVLSVLLKTVKAIQQNQDPVLIEVPGMSYNWDEDSKFFADLFKLTVQKDKEYEEMISEKAKNWEMERIAAVDKVILKMALCEMINFPSIPVKVTINEYIEISKLYSTPKSRHFINGILDVLAKELKDSGVIKKSGRGLIDNK